MVLDPMSIHTQGCGPFEGLLHTPSIGTQKKDNPTESCLRGSMSAPGACRASFFDHSPPVPVFAPPHQTIWRTLWLCPWCTSRGCRVQMSRPWDPWLSVMENSRLFAQRGHSARCAPQYVILGTRLAFEGDHSHFMLLECSWMSLGGGGGRKGGPEIVRPGPLIIAPTPPLDAHIAPSTAHTATRAHDQRPQGRAEPPPPLPRDRQNVVPQGRHMCRAVRAATREGGGAAGHEAAVQRCGPRSVALGLFGMARALRGNTAPTAAGLKGECLPGTRSAHARRTTFVLSILALAPSLSPPREAPQVDRTRP